MNKKENKIITSKYNKYTFFFVNMYHQLSKPSNMFFLLTLILISIPPISPFNPYAYLLAFCLVTGISMIKDGIEDYRRHKQDRIMNKKPVQIVKCENDIISMEEIFVENLEKGNFVFLKNNEEIPGDCVLLVSKVNTKGGYKCKNYCFVDSSNLDGESNLKKKTSFEIKKCNKTINLVENICPELMWCQCDKDFIKKINGSELKDTGDVFNKFECTILSDNQNIFCNERNVLLKGMKLKNVETSLAYVVAVGKNSKLGKSNIASRKGTSLFEMELTKIVKIVFVLYFFLLFTSSIFGSLFVRKTNIEYLYLNKYLSAEAFKYTGTNYILFSYLIPLSLFVTLEVSRMFHSAYIKNDTDMIKDDIRSICRNSNVSEDLGMIEYILSDKTGTLTKNTMKFKKIHIGYTSELENVSLLNFQFLNLNDIQTELENLNAKLLFALVLICCNSVEPLNGKFEGISQDEICIIEALKDNNIVLLEREDMNIKIKIDKVILKIEIKHILDFSSSRQRMSVVVRIFNKNYLFIKGSDQMMIDIKKTKSDQISLAQLHFIINSNSTFRTLITAYRKISDEDFLKLDINMKKVSLENKDYEQEELFNDIETNLKYLGTTFIEDELQDEVFETINILKKAYIKIWMITGDKKETAISCAINCGIMTGPEDEEVKVLEGKDFVKNIDTNNIFNYKSVILFRSTPKQKGEIALKFKNLQKNTLAVGDGNNDVPMLLTANVGVGILGKEGNQAGLSADFAIPEFKSLKHLILKHGRYNFIRFSKVTLNAFYKNTYLITIQYLYNFFTGFSGKPVYNTYFLNYFNVFFTSLIPASICCFDKDLPESYLFDHPEKYKTVKLHFCKSIFLVNLFYGILQGLITFILICGVIYKKDLISNLGKVGGYNALNNIFSIVVFFTVFLGQIRNISFYSFFSYLAIFLSLSLNFIILFLVQDISFGGRVWNLLSIPSGYFLLLFILLVSYIMELIMSTIFNYIVEKKIVNKT